MAKRSKIVKNNERAKIVARFKQRRAELVAIVKSADVSYEAKRDAYRELAKLPRDSSATRHRNRCGVSGRPRGYFRKFGMSRSAVRELAHRGELPGVRKASW